MPVRIVIEPAYYTGVPVRTFDESSPSNETTHPSFDAAIAYWQCEYGYANPQLVDRTSGRYVVAFETAEKTLENDKSL